jgi:hypothetical protein
MTLARPDGSRPSDNVIPFPKAIKRGRKRVTRYTTTGAGDISLMLLARDGEQCPSNVERFRLARDRADSVSDQSCSLFRRWDEAQVLGLSIYEALPAEMRIAVHKHIGSAAYGNHDAADLRVAANSLLNRILAVRGKPSAA